MSQSNHDRVSNHNASGLINKIKLRGKFSTNQQLGMPAINQSKAYRTISVNSQDRRSSKQSIRSRIAMPKIRNNNNNT